MDADETSRLTAAIETAARAAGHADARVSGLRRLGGGASKESWGFVLESGGRRLESVLRCEPVLSRFAAEGSIPIATEAALLRAARGQAVPVPLVHFELPPESGFPGYVMECVHGESVGPRILKDEKLAGARAGLARQCGHILAGLHRMATSSLPPLERLGPAELLVRYRQRYLATGQARPIFDLAFDWIEQRLPDEAEPTLVHGDFRNGNLMVGADGVRAVFDWEMAHIGHPAEDLGWLCVTSWRFQRPELRVGGFGAAEDLLAAYREAGGRAVRLEELHHWDTFGTLRWGVMCAEVGVRFMDGVRTVEGAMIARRASETEYDLIRLIGGGHD